MLAYLTVLAIAFGLLAVLARGLRRLAPPAVPTGAALGTRRRAPASGSGLRAAGCASERRLSRRRLVTEEEE